jgi:molybdopterin-binding protein
MRITFASRRASARAFRNSTDARSGKRKKRPKHAERAPSAIVQNVVDGYVVCDYSFGMKLSARNHLVGKVEEVKLGNVMAHVTVRVGENIVESVITRRSAEEMELKVGDTVAAIIKSTEVMLQKD